MQSGFNVRQRSFRWAAIVPLGSDCSAGQRSFRWTAGRSVGQRKRQRHLRWATDLPLGSGCSVGQRFIRWATKVASGITLGNGRTAGQRKIRWAVDTTDGHWKGPLPGRWTLHERRRAKKIAVTQTCRTADVPQRNWCRVCEEYACRRGMRLQETTNQPTLSPGRGLLVCVPP